MTSEHSTRAPYSVPFGSMYRILTCTSFVGPTISLIKRRRCSGLLMPSKTLLSVLET